MALRWSSLAALAAFSVLLPGCKARPKVQPVTVRVFRDLASPYASALDHRLLDFQATNPRLANGALVQVGSLTIADLQTAMLHFDEQPVDIVILDSPADAAKYPALQGDMAHAVNVCAAMEACPAEVPALVPSKLQGERAEAANQFVQYLAAKTMPPAAAAQPATPQAAPAETPAQPAKQ